MTMNGTSTSRRASASVAFRGVGVTFKPSGRPPVRALDDLTFDVNPGEFVAVVGASGSGKSTLLRLVSGLIAPTEGEVLVSGEAVIGPGLDRAMVFQSDCLLPWQTVLDNAAYGLRIAGWSRASARESAMEQLRLVGLADFASVFPHQLSGGMRQRVNIARALAVDPGIVLLDEPFASLDAQTRELMAYELLRIWARDQKTVLFITHQLDEAVYLADRVVILTAHPGTVREAVDIPFPRPRELALKRAGEFGAIVEHLWSLIEDEVRSSFGGETHD